MVASEPPEPKPSRDKSAEQGLVGRIVAGKYRVLEVLGQGGFGSVFLVEIIEGIVGDRLAMKILPKEFGQNPVLRDQFINEIRVAMKMVDKYIVQIRDVGVTEDRLLYYTMDYVPGKTLSRIIREEKKLPAPRTLRVVLRVLRALETAHAAGIIHRDLKPANIMVQVRQGKETVRVLDFGIATAIGPEVASGKERGFAGSPYYMPPEQFLGTDMSFYTDLYSVGVILYECLTGRKPYTGNTPQEVYNSIKSGPPVPVDVLAPEVRAYPGLAELVMQALERNPQRRLQSAREFFEKVNAILSAGQPVGQAGPESSLGRLGERTRDDGRPEATASSTDAFSSRKRAARTTARRRGAPRVSGAPRARGGRVRRGNRGRREKKSSAVGATIAALVILGLVAAGVIFRDQILGHIREMVGDGRDRGASSEGKATPESPSNNSGVASPQKKHDSEGAPADQKSGGDSKSPVDVHRARQVLNARLESYLSDGYRALVQEQWAKAEEYADSVLQLDPENAHALRLRGTARFRLEQYTEAAQDLEKAVNRLEKEEVDTAFLLLLADVYLALPDADAKEKEAEKLLVEIWKKDPKNPKAPLRLLRLYERQGNKRKLEILLEQAHKAGIRDEKLESLYQELIVEAERREKAALQKHVETARTTFAEGSYEKAAQAAAAAVEISPLPEMDHILVEAMTKLGDLDAAQTALDRLDRKLQASQEAGPDSPEAKLDPELRLRVLYLKGRNAYLRYQSQKEKEKKRDLLVEADLELTQLLEKELNRRTHPQLFALARTYRGCVYAVDGDLDQVEKEFKATYGDRQLEVVEVQARTFYDLAQKLKGNSAKLKGYELARGRLLTLTKVRDLPEELNRRAYYLLGNCYYEIGALRDNDDSTLRKAVNRFQEARDAGLDSAELHEKLGDSYARLLNFMQAAASYRTAYEREPTAERCLQAAKTFREANRDPQARAVLEDGLRRFRDNVRIQRMLLEFSRR